MCNKIIYKKKEALAIIRRLNRNKKHRKGRFPRRAYECDICNGWHLTSWEEFPEEIETEPVTFLEEFKKYVQENTNDFSPPIIPANSECDKRAGELHS